MGATGKDLHIDQNLTNIAINYRPVGMIADLVAPIVPVAKQSDFYAVWDQADAFRTEDDKRAPGTEAHLITRSVSSGTYFADNYALKTRLTIEDRENMDAAYVGELRNGRAAFLKSKIALNWEKRLADNITTGANVGSYSTVISDWVDTTAGNSDPIGDIETGINNVYDSTGYRPNRCLMGELAWRHLRKHDDVAQMLYGSITAGTPRRASREQFKNLFEFDEFIVGQAYYNSADEGQSLALAKMWLDYVLFYYAPPSPSTEEPSFMYSFRWNKPGLANMTVEKHPYDTKTKSEEIELGYYQDEKITAKNLGFLLTHVTSV